MIQKAGHVELDTKKSIGAKCVEFTFNRLESWSQQSLLSSLPARSNRNSKNERGLCRFQACLMNGSNKLASSRSSKAFCVLYRHSLKDNELNKSPCFEQLKVQVKTRYFFISFLKKSKAVTSPYFRIRPLISEMNY